MDSFQTSNSFDASQFTIMVEINKVTHLLWKERRRTEIILTNSFSTKDLANNIHNSSGLSVEIPGRARRKALAEKRNDNRV